MSVLALIRQLRTDTSLPYIIVDMIALHTRIDRKSLHSLRNRSANGVGTAASSIDHKKHARGRGGVQTTLVPRSVLSTAYAHARTALLDLHPVMKIKTTKIDSDSYYQLLTRIDTPENYPPYGLLLVATRK